MVEVVKRCSFPMMDGYKCNKPFKVSSAKSGVRKYCDEHIGNDAKYANQYSENKLVIAILIAGLAGIICGWLFGPAMLAVAWLGDLFLDALITPFASTPGCLKKFLSSADKKELITMLGIDS